MTAVIDSFGNPILDSSAEPILDRLPALLPIPTVISPIISAEISLFQDLISGPQWGLFDEDGNLVVTAEVVVGFNYRKEFRVADFPIEEGAFSSYNKVQCPFDCRITFAQAISDFDRSELLQTMEDISGSLDLFTMITPEISYENVNVVSFEYRRSMHEGSKLLVVEAYCRQIRIVTPAAYSKVQNNTDDSKDSSSANPQDGGTVSPTTTEVAASPKVQARWKSNVHASEATGGI